ncbi:MAG: DUF4230 domain-containing protein [Hungatella hathewayi]|nr:DUF4230 domain-containing protein [Hungatella hathewayi]
MKKNIVLILTLCIMILCVACGKEKKEAINTEPQVSQMKSICELAVMECYYHNVAKYTEEDASGILWWKKDKHFWIEYSGIVKLGVDVSLVNIEVNDTQITITLPNAKVLGCKVDSSSLTKESYIVDKGSADIKAEDEIFAFEKAQSKLEETASNDKVLLAEAQQRAQVLLEGYVRNIGDVVGKEYTIKWNYIEKDKNTSGITSDEVSSVEIQNN